MFLDTIFDDTIFDFLRDDYFFNSTVKDMSPIAYYKKGKDYILEVKTLGISADDISVEFDGNLLKVFGETKNEYNDKPFNAKISVRLGKTLTDNLESIDYKSKDGVTYLFLRMKETKEDAVAINRI